MNYRWSIVLSMIGVLTGVILFLYESTFNVWMSTCTANGPCPHTPFSFYFYDYFPLGIVAVSMVALLFSLRHRAVKAI